MESVEEKDEKGMMNLYPPSFLCNFGQPAKTQNENVTQPE